MKAAVISGNQQQSAALSGTHLLEVEQHAERREAREGQQADEHQWRLADERRAFPEGILRHAP